MTIYARESIERVLAQIVEERKAQDEKWGEQNHPDGTGLNYWAAEARLIQGVNEEHATAGASNWCDILYEEVCEAFAEAEPEKLRAELVQVAAVAVQWIEAIDRRRTWKNVGR